MMILRSIRRKICSVGRRSDPTRGMSTVREEEPGTSATNTPKPKSSVEDKNEKDFKDLRDEWWRGGGEFEILRRMNELRVPLITDAFVRGGSQDSAQDEILKGISIIDVGCGGGLLSEPLARLGASVVGIDLVESNIECARAHAEQDESLKGRLTYICGRIEDVKGRYDALVASEVLEHVSDSDEFIKHCARVVKPNGHLFFTTINRTVLSLLVAKIGAEYILNVVPRGMHDWGMFVKPKDLELTLARHGCSVAVKRGMIYHMIQGYWQWTSADCVNYALHAVKR